MSCEVSENCINAGYSCWICKFDPSTVGGDNQYIAINKAIKHPQIEAAKKAKKRQEKAAKREASKTKDKAKSAVVRKAAKVEEIVRKTLNSGRINRDGDLVTKDLGIDVKLQTTRVDPVIFVNEFEKCRADARRAGKDDGVLAIQNKEGQRFYVISEELFKERLLDAGN